MPDAPVPTPDASAAVRPEIEQRLARLIRERSVSAEVKENGPAAFEALLEELYPLVHAKLETEKIGELGLLYHWPARDLHRDAAHPRRPTEAPAVLMAHFDTVPIDPDDSWAHDPFGGEIVDGHVWGRGAIDDKGALCVVLEAVENLLAAGYEPARDVYLSFGGDEETFGTAAEQITDELESRGIRPWIVLDEGGAIVDGVLPTVNVPSAVVGVGEKGTLSVLLHTTAEAGHSSVPSRQLSATARIARAVTRVSRNPFPKRLNDTSREMFDRYATRATGIGKVLTTVVPKIGPISARLLAQLGGEPAAMVQTTVTTTRLDAGTADNVLPSQASATLNLRIALGETVASTLARLKRAIRDPKIEFTVISSSEPSPASRTDIPQWRLIEDAVEAAYPGTLTVPYVMLGASDSRHFHPRTPDATYRLAPLHMSAAIRAGLHGVDERVSVDALRRGEVFYRRLIESL